MSAPLNVAVMRPKKTGPETVGYFIGGALGTLGVAWVLMLIAGEVTTWDPSYRHTLLALVAVRLLQTGSGWRLWTHRQKGSWQ